MTEEQRYCIMQIQQLQNKSRGIKIELDQTNVALNSFTNALIASLEEGKNIEKADKKKAS